jgi:hypothetical protein
MPGRIRAIVVAFVTASLLIVGAVPAFAPYSRQAGEAFNLTEACPKYVSFEVASMEPVPPTATIQAYSPPSEIGNPAALVLNRTLRLRRVEEPFRPLDPEDPADFSHHRRAVLRWDTGRLAPNTEIAIGSANAVSDPASFVVSRVSDRCDPPHLRLDRVCSQSTDQLLTWRVRNPESRPVDFNAEVLGTRPAQIRIGTVPANGEANFQTTRVSGLNIVLLFVGGILVDVELGCLRR